MNYKLPLVLTPQVEGGYTVTSPLLPELVTEGDSVAGALSNVKDALAAVVELTRIWDVHCLAVPGFHHHKSRYGLKLSFPLRDLS